jgi:tRNA uridine 5-carbamoylmethylation protein Kti12
MKIILLNCAPFSGKDTLANRLVDRLDNTEYVMFKQPLYERFAERHNLP